MSILSERSGLIAVLFDASGINTSITAVDHDIVGVLDGDTIYKGCGLGLKQCDANSPCPLHYKFVDIRENLKNMLESTSITSLLNDMNLEGFILKR